MSDMQRTSSSGLVFAAQDSAQSTIRPRNRRSPASAALPAASSSAPPPHSSAATRPATTLGRSLLEGSWSSSWASMQEIASSLLTSGAGNANDSPLFAGNTPPGPGRNGSRSRKSASRSLSTSGRSKPRTNGAAWGPEPPKPPGGGDGTRPSLERLAAGSLAGREAALRAARTASVLESHDGVNGGLDVAGRFKKRRSDEDLCGATRPVSKRGGSLPGNEVDDYMVYIHHVQKDDTYAGIVLKYRCREDAFRKANGLWSRDNIQVRKRLALPVNACEVRGRPCGGPAGSATADLLALTPEQAVSSDGFFGSVGVSASTVDGMWPGSEEQCLPTGTGAKGADEERPWAHLRWVMIDNFPQPVEIARVSRRRLGYFPPRRKKSLQAASSVTSTPRNSVETSGALPPMGSETGLDSPASNPSTWPTPRPSTGLIGQPGHLSSSAYGATTPTSTSARSRGCSTGAPEDARPAWMRRPGGVGSMGRSVHAPGPEKDYFNSWTKKHLPGLNLDSLPSMSVMGAEIARFGFGGSGKGGASLGMNGNSHAVDDSIAPPGIVLSPVADGYDVAALSRGGEGAASSPGANHGTGLDKAAAAIETWLRGAWARKPLTPVTGPRGPRSWMGEEDGDLIELADANSDDGGGRGRDDGTGPGRGRFGLLDSTGEDSAFLRPGMTFGPSGRASGEQNIAVGIDGSSTVRGTATRLRGSLSALGAKGDKGD